MLHLFRSQKTDTNRAFRQRVKDIGTGSSVPPAGSKKKKTTGEDIVAVGQLEVEEVSVKYFCSSLKSFDIVMLQSRNYYARSRLILLNALRICIMLNLSV